MWGFNYFKKHPDLLVMLIIALLMWFILPFIQFNHARPFTPVTIRILMISLFALGMIIKNLIPKLTVENRNQLIKYFNQLKTKIQGLIIALAHIAPRRHYFPRRFMTFLILGTAGSGKTSLIRNSHLDFLNPSLLPLELTASLKMIPEIEWCATAEAVIIETAHVDKSSESTRKLLKFLRKNNKRQPLNGVILTSKLIDLLLMDPHAFQKHVNAINNALLTLHHGLNVKIPLYILFTQCDLIAGFTQFFAHLSKEELTQVWGYTFPHPGNDEAIDLQGYFKTAYHDLLLRLQQQSIWLLDAEKSQTNREWITLFPQQMQLFKTAIATFLTKLSNATQDLSFLQIRGFYFCSALQKDTPYDFANRFIATPLGLSQQIMTSQTPRTEVFFLTHLFHAVLFKEGRNFGWNRRIINVKKWCHRLSVILAPMLVILVTLYLHSTYKNYLYALQFTQQNINDYQTAKADLNDDNPSLIKVFPLLNTLDDAHHMLASQSSRGFMLLARDALQSSLQQALMRHIHNMFLPRIAVYFENQLKKDTTDANLVYALLKAYLAFGPQYADPTAIIAPMEYYGSTLMHFDPVTQNELKHYLLLATQHRLDELPIDHSLINHMRVELEQIIPVERAYGLLTFKAATSDLSNLNLNELMGETASAIFQTNTITIPNLYTKAGYSELFVKSSPKIAAQVAEDNRDIGLTPTHDTNQNTQALWSALAVEYAMHYEKTWHDALQSLKIKPINNLGDANHVLELLLSNNSLLLSLDNTLHDQIGFLQNKPFNRHLDWSNYNHAQLQKSLLALHQYFSNLSQSSNSAEAQFNALQDFLNDDLNNPLRVLLDISTQLPSPWQTWLSCFVNNCFAILANNSLIYIQNAWDTQVVPLFQAQFAAHYPISPASNADIDLEQFHNFFSPEGVLSHFFSHYLSAFINTSVNPWQLNQIAALKININPDMLIFFQNLLRIQQNYFPNNTHQLQHAFSLTPLILDSSASAIDLSLGGQTILYRHGPQYASPFVWPYAQSAMESKLTIHGFSGPSFSLEYSGPWSLFRLLNQGMLQQSQPGLITLLFKLNHLSATFELKSSHDIYFWQLSLLKNISLPQHVQPLKLMENHT